MAQEYRRVARAMQCESARSQGFFASHFVVPSVQRRHARPAVALLAAVVRGNACPWSDPGPAARVPSGRRRRSSHSTSASTAAAAKTPARSRERRATTTPGPCSTTGSSGIRLEPAPGGAGLRAAVSRVTGNSLEARRARRLWRCGPHRHRPPPRLGDRHRHRPSGVSDGAARGRTAVDPLPDRRLRCANGAGDVRNSSCRGRGAGPTGRRLGALIR